MSRCAFGENGSFEPMQPLRSPHTPAACHRVRATPRIDAIATECARAPIRLIRSSSMKRNTLATMIAAGMALAAGVAPEVQAVHLDPGGAGQVLIYPYYTVNSGNQTLFSVINKTDAGKAIKVRFREGYNSRKVLEFNLYLSPFDVWTASVFSLNTGAGNPANLVTTDNSCTVPRIKGNPSLPVLANGLRYVPFTNYYYVGGNEEAGPNVLDRTREGHFELIEMGEVVNRERNSLSAIIHNFGEPGNCQRIQEAWMPDEAQVSNYWTNNALVDIDPPKGGLFGAASIIDTLSGTMMRYDAEAIAAFRTIALHTGPSATEPTLASAHENSVDNTVTANVFRDGTVVASRYPAERAIDAVSALFMQEQVYGEFTSSAAMGAASEWILTFPTKYAYVDQAIVGAFAIQPFTRIFPTTAIGDVPNSAVDLKLDFFDREEGAGQSYCFKPSDPACIPISPPPPQPFPNPRLLWSSNVLSFNQPAAALWGSTILGSRLSNNVGTDLMGIADGWAALTLYTNGALSGQQMRPDTDGVVWLGLPVVGFRATVYSTSEVTPGVFSSNADLSRLRSTNRIQGSPFVGATLEQTAQ